MNASWSSRFLITAAVYLLTSRAAAADSQPAIALDFHVETKVKGCPSAERFGDEVAARLGFVPWDPQAAGSLRVRIARDGDDFVGTIEQPGGASKVLRGKSCARLAEALTTAIAVVLDRGAPDVPAVPSPSPQERRLQRLARDDDPQGLVTIRLRAPNRRKLEVSRVIDRSMLSGRYSVSAVSYEKVCEVPCTAKVRAGAQSWIVNDLETGEMVSEDATVNTNSTLDIDYVSNAQIRKTSYHRMGWSLLVGGAVGTVATAYYIESSDVNRAYHSFDALGFAGGMILGGVVGYLISPRPISDTAQITVRAGLTDAVGAR